MVTESSHDESVFEEKNTPSGRKKRVLWLGGILLLIGTGAIIISRLSSQSPSQEAVEEINPLPVETMTVTPESSYEVSRSYTGEIQARRSSELGLERGGKITEIFVAEGDRVSRGDPLARLDTRNLEAKKRQLQAQRDRALAQLEQLQTGPRQEDIAAARARVRNVKEELALLKTQRSRREFLYSEGAISQEQRDEFASREQALQARLEEAQSQLQELLSGTRPEEIAAQQATVKEIEASLEDVEITLDKSVLTAPFDGIIAQRLLDEGTVVQTGQSVLQLMENSAPEARIGVPPQVAKTLQPETSTTVTIAGESYNATVESILPQVEAPTRTRTVVFRLQREALLETTPGQTVRFHHEQNIASSGYWLPVSALTKGTRGLWRVYVVVPSDERDGWEVQPEAVEIIHEGENRAFVRGTLQAEAKLVANGTHRLVPGQPVALNYQE